MMIITLNFFLFISVVNFMIQWYVRSAMTQVFEMCGCVILSEWNFHAFTRVYIRNFDKLFYRLKWKCHFNWYWPHTQPALNSVQHIHCTKFFDGKLTNQKANQFDRFPWYTHRNFGDLRKAEKYLQPNSNQFRLVFCFDFHLEISLGIFVNQQNQRKQMQLHRSLCHMDLNIDDNSFGAVVIIVIKSFLSLFNYASIII